MLLLTLFNNDYAESKCLVFVLPTSQVGGIALEVTLPSARKDDSADGGQQPGLLTTHKIPLETEVNPDSCLAKFSKKTKTLTVTLTVI